MTPIGIVDAAIILLVVVGFIFTVAVLTKPRARRAPLREAQIVAMLDLQRSEARARLAQTPEFAKIAQAAKTEAIETPDRWFARNLEAITVEMAMDSIPETLRRLRGGK